MRRTGPLLGVVVAACGAAAPLARPAPTIPPSGNPAIPTAGATTAGSAVPAATTGTTVAPSATPGAPPPLDATWGASAPTTLVAAAPDRRWLAVCQARRDTDGNGRLNVDVGAQGELAGDALDGFFIDAPGAGFGIDAFVGSDPSGRYVAFVRSTELFLRDTTTRLDTNLSKLGADVRDDLASFVGPRAGAFDARGHRFLYLRRDETGVRVVVRDLAAETETVIDAGPGELYRAAFDPSGLWVIVRVVAADTNGNGRLEWPVPEATTPRARCTGPLPTYAIWERPGDEAVVRVASVNGGVAMDAPTLVVPVGDEFVSREADGSFVRGRPGAAHTTIIRAGCAPHLLHADVSRRLLLVTCTGPKGRADAIVLGKDVVKPLGLELAVAAGDRVHEEMPRLIALHPGTDAVLLDLDTKRTEKLQPYDRILFVADTHAVILRKRQLVLHGFGGTEEALPGEVSPLPRMLQAGSAVLVSPFVVDLAQGKLLGFTSETPLGLSVDGAVLSATGDADATHLAQGPLHWSLPTPSLAPRVQ